jgi:hypothetical protein
MSKLESYARRIFLGAATVVVACMPLVILAEKLGWNQRPIHKAQSFVAVPVACLASGLYLWGRRGQPGDGAMRALAWLVFVVSLLWTALLAYVLWFADYSWMDQK